VRVIVLVSLWALEWERHSAEINLSCARILRIYMLNPNILEFLGFQDSNVHSDNFGWFVGVRVGVTTFFFWINW